MAKMTAVQADKVDRMNPDSQAVGLGTRAKFLEDYAPLLINHTIAADATGAPTAFVAPCDMEIVDIIVQARATSSDATVTPIDAGAAGSGTDAMCTAIACAADGAVTHMSAGADDTHLILSAGDVVKVDASAADVRGLVTFIAKRTA